MNAILRIAEVRRKTGLSKSTIYADRHFPKPIQLTSSGKAVGWLESEVVEWMNARVAATRNRVQPAAQGEASPA